MSRYVHVEGSCSDMFESEGHTFHRENAAVVDIWTNQPATSQRKRKSQTYTCGEEMRVVQNKHCSNGNSLHSHLYISVFTSYITLVTFCIIVHNTPVDVGTH